MTFVGDTKYWDDLFQREFVPSVLDCVIAAWATMAKPSSTEKERQIALKLYCELVNTKDRSRLPFRFGYETVEVDTVAIAEIGRKDIVAYPRGSDSEDILFCLEAKRLNVVQNGHLTSLATKYVTEGMQRYVDGKYAKAVSHGAMIGFVMNGNLKDAKKRVGSKIKKNWEALGLAARTGLGPSTIRRGDRAVKETVHTRPHDSMVFRIHHVFLAVV